MKCLSWRHEDVIFPIKLKEHYDMKVFDFVYIIYVHNKVLFPFFEVIIRIITSKEFDYNPKAVPQKKELIPYSIILSEKNKGKSKYRQCKLYRLSKKYITIYLLSKMCQNFIDIQYY